VLASSNSGWSSTSRNTDQQQAGPPNLSVKDALPKL